MRMLYVIPVAVVIALSAAVFIFMTGIVNDWKFVKGSYASTPKADGAVDVEELLRLVKQSNSNTYNIIVRDEASFSDMGRLLDRAGDEGIDIWVTLIPPSGGNEQFTDYTGYARRIAEMSLEYENLKAWSIDNVLIDYAYFTPSYLKSITEAAKEVNPNLHFVPVAYYQNVVSPLFEERSGYFDGIQFYYTHFPEPGVDESSVLMPMLEEVNKRFDGIVILGVYATPWSEEYPTTPAYVEQLINLAKQHTDGVMVYTLQREGEKLDAISRAFGD
jgi:hypothetical protein